MGAIGWRPGDHRQVPHRPAAPALAVVAALLTVAVLAGPVAAVPLVPRFGERSGCPSVFPEAVNTSGSVSG